MRTVIAGGSVVTASDTYAADVLIENGLIVAIGTDFAVDASDVVIDATGKLVLPGGIDVHTHLAMPFGGTTSIDDFITGHEAALHGGTTSHIDFVIQERGQSLQAALDTWRAKAENNAVMDYGFHIAITDARPEIIDELESMVDQGVTSFKLFLAYPGSLMVDDDVLFAVMQRAAELGALVMVHAENGPVIAQLVERALADGNTDPKYHAATRPAELEAEATGRAVALANVAGASLYVVHVTCEGAARVIEQTRADGHRNIHGETCTQYLYLSADDLARPGFEGAKYVCSPPLRTAADQAYLWGAVQDDGGLEVISTDHCPFNYAGQKELGRGDFTKIPNGMPGIEERMALLSEGVHAGHLGWNRAVELTATNPAKLFGLYPHKGTIAVGADADLVVWDPEAVQTLSAADVHGANDHSVYEGLTVHGRADVVLSRGDVVVDHGTLTAPTGRGRFLHRARHGSATGQLAGATIRH